MSTALATLAHAARQLAAERNFDTASRGLCDYAPGASNHNHHDHGDTLHMTVTRARTIVSETTVSLTIKRAPHTGHSA